MADPKDVTILVVDDEPALRQALVFDFKRRGFQVLDAGNGKEAFELIKAHPIDIVLSDIKMPGGDGIELLDRIREMNPKTPVVMLITGFADLTTEEAYERGANAVFSKPFDRKALIATVMQAVENKGSAWSTRKFERVDTEFNIELKFAGSNQVIPGRVLNISRGGIFVALPDSFPAVETKTEFRFCFETGDPEELGGTGIVRWIRMQTSPDHPSGCGVEFQSLSDQSRRKIIELINESKTRSFIPSK